MRSKSIKKQQLGSDRKESILLKLPAELRREIYDCLPTNALARLGRCCTTLYNDTQSQLLKTGVLELFYRRIKHGRAIDNYSHALKIMSQIPPTSWLAIRSVALYAPFILQDQYKVGPALTGFEAVKKQVLKNINVMDHFTISLQLPLGPGVGNQSANTLLRTYDSILPLLPTERQTRQPKCDKLVIFLQQCPDNCYGLGWFTSVSRDKKKGSAKCILEVRLAKSILYEVEDLFTEGHHHQRWLRLLATIKDIWDIRVGTYADVQWKVEKEKFLDAPAIEKVLGPNSVIDPQELAIQ